MKTYWSKEEAYIIVDCIGEDLLRNNDKYVYVAPVIDAEVKVDDNYFIEIGIYDGGTKSLGDIIPPVKIIKKCLSEKIQLYSEPYQNKLMDKLDNLDSFPIEKNNVGLITLQNHSGLKIRPVLSGTEISNGETPGKTGTLGALFTLKNEKYYDPRFPDEDRKIFGITNFHCVAEFPESNDKSIYQPKKSPHLFDNYIGEVLYSQYLKDEDKGETYDLDVAIFELNRHSVREQRLLGEAFYSSGYNVDREPGEGMIKGLVKEEDIKIGQEVQIYGKTTPKSPCGILRSTYCTVKVENFYYDENKSHPMTNDKYHIFKKQFLITNISKPGDSGSIVVNHDTKKAIGLIFAGDADEKVGKKKVTIANNIHHVFKNVYDMDDIKLKLELNYFIT